ncbi:MAG TPA: hypothetical protein VMA73_34195 [Streptosporangiaceae bacterium]|nr:hypothetical protein [Streptosporangiaceae bacterium]
MDDLMILGSDREPSPWRRRLGVVAVLIMAAVVAITHLPGKRDTPPRHPAVSISVSMSAGPVQLAGLGSGAADLLDQADGITRPASPATSSSPASGPQRHGGHHSTRRCADHAVMRAGAGSRPGVLEAIAVQAVCSSLPGT